LSDVNQNSLGESLEQEIEEEESDTAIEEEAEEEEEQQKEEQQEDFDEGVEDDQIKPESMFPQIEKRDRSQPVTPEAEPTMHVKRQEKRVATRDQAKPVPAINKSNDRRNRAPTESTIEKPLEPYDEIDNPSPQILPKGVEPSRAEQIIGTGELQGIGRKILMKEASRMQAYRTAFIAWQSQRDDYVIFQKTGHDPQTGNDIWEPMHYAIHFLTIGQSARLKNMNYDLLDLRRAAQNNDPTVTDVYKKIGVLEDALLKLKLSLYFRMYIGKRDKRTGTLDPDDELENSSQIDVRDMVDSAEWCFQWVPKSRRIKPSDTSGLKAESEYDMIR
jgi:hypothetical protein